VKINNLNGIMLRNTFFFFNAYICKKMSILPVRMLEWSFCFASFSSKCPSHQNYRSEL